MPEETLVEAAPSSAEATPSLDIPRSNTPEYQQWRETGNIPEVKPKNEAPATSDAPKETTSEAEEPESEAATDSAKSAQEQRRKPKPNAEARISELTERLRLAEQKLEAGNKTQAEPSSPAKPPAQPQNYQDWRKTFKPTQWVEDYGKANPEATYEDANAAMSDYLGDVRDQFRANEQARESQSRELNAKIDAARNRYENFNEAVSPFVDKFVSDTSISPLVKSMVNDSDVFADLAFTLAGDSKFMEVAKDTGKAIRYIAKVESLIEEELAKGAKPETPRSESGRFTKVVEPEAPVKRGPESAPAPPLEIGSRGTGPVDESERALQSIERGDGNAFRTWMDAENRKDLKRRSGA